MSAGIATPKELAGRYGVNVFTVYRWKREARLQLRLSPGGRWFAVVDPDGFALPPPATTAARSRPATKKRKSRR